jgi:hypothetical protein
LYPVICQKRLPLSMNKRTSRFFPYNYFGRGTVELSRRSMARALHWNSTQFYGRKFARYVPRVSGRL